MNPTETDRGCKQWFRSANCDGRYGVALLASVLVLAGLTAAGARLRLGLQYDRTALAAGQLWRLLSAHLVHMSAVHAAADIAGLVLLWVLFARDFRPAQWLIILIVGMLGIDAGLWFFSPDIEWYLGASGVLHTVWAAGSQAALARREPFGAILIGALVLKLASEQLHGGSLFVAGIPVVVNAHLYGALAGLACARILNRHPKSL